MRPHGTWAAEEVHNIPHGSSGRAENPYQALMECAPGDEPELSKQELEPLRAILNDAIDRLSPRDQWIFTALVYRRMSVRALGRELALSKTHIARERDRIMSELRVQLLDAGGMEAFVVA